MVDTKSKVKQVVGAPMDGHGELRLACPDTAIFEQEL